ncbi:MAG TPA: MBL fold metallo-hydrolase [Candidatus Polarisedimenticolaceae bacterium]|nr:MBL fold metallo-hydrolase [Candidatus Polarisedimenticolaceae bacterium]
MVVLPVDLLQKRVMHWNRHQAALVLLLLLAACGRVSTEQSVPGQPPHHVEGGFRNTNAEFKRPSRTTRWHFMARRLWASFTSPRTFEAPRVANDGKFLQAGLINPSITWVGHATLLVQINGVNALTDPQWNERASPVSWGGPRRLSPPGLGFEHLPPIHVVIISHDHYDHLDLTTVKRLAESHNPLFLVPLGMKAWFANNGMNHVEELDWWQEREYRGVKFVCLPAQHFSQRTLWDANARLWASWAMVSPERRLYFSGDTGYFAGFKEIGRKLGPFNLAAVAIGAYVPPEIMKSVHTTPEEAVQTSIDLNAGILLGIHWGTFDLAEEPLEEPPQRMLAEVTRRRIDRERAWIFKIGETRKW